MSSFFTKLEKRVESINSLLCVGLDPHPKELYDLSSDEWETKLTEEEKCDAAYTFCKTIVLETLDYAAAYKPNVAFFESLGTNLGLATLRRVVTLIHEKSNNEVPVLLDCKRGDIGSTAAAYADASYRDLLADGVTLSPLMGYDSLQPFITGNYTNKGAFILCKTSNPGSNDLLALHIQNNETLFEKIAKLSVQWSKMAAAESNTEYNNLPSLGLVVGATDPHALAKARAAAGENTWILAPGVGFQGGSLEESCRAGLNLQKSKLLVPISRGISRATNIAETAKEFRDLLNAARQSVVSENNSNNFSIKPYQKDFLEFSLGEGVLKFGEFVLKSGRTSPYFFNAGLFASGRSLSKLGKSYAAAIMNSPELLSKEAGGVNFDVIFGPAYKGISLGAVVCAALYDDYGIDVGFAYNRKEAKDHGEGGVLVGCGMKGKKILVIDDVITAGTAIRESYNMLKDIGAIPVGVSIALDRAEKRSLEDPVSAVQAVARDLEIPVVSIVSLPQLQSFLVNNPNYDADVLERVSAYRAQYGV